MVDLHTHSTASDGSLSPGLLIEEAAKLRISAIALTDHDTIDGLEEAKTAARKNGIRLIPGVELQINWKQESDSNSGQFHLLGIGIRNPSGDFLKALEELRETRKKRNLEILERMEEHGINCTYDELLEFSGGKIVGRLHFASYLISKRIVRNIDQAFKRYLSPGKPFYVPKAGLDFPNAVSLIKESDGIAVLAHPLSLHISWGHMPVLLKKLKDDGLDGIEAWHPAAKKSACVRLEEQGKNLGLYITAGSDFHGERRTDRRLGITGGGRKIDESILNTIPVLTDM